MKKIKIVLLVAILLFITGCDGNVTRDIRHGGFNIGSSDFTCSTLMPDKEGKYEKIKFFTSSFAITEKGQIYDLSLGQVYASKQNCRKAATDIKIEAIYNNSIGRGNDGKYYYLVASNGVEAYKEVTVNDNDYSIIDLLLKDKTVIKAMPYDTNSGIYYVLKDDGNIYGYTCTRADYNAPFTITAIALVYNQDDYGSKIIDFNDVGNNPATFIRTKKEIFKMTVTNLDKCSKYADVSCTYKLKKSEVLNKNIDYILAYNGSMLITTYGKEFTVSN